VLVVLRHGRAESFAAEDHQRRLTDRGRASALAAGRWLAQEGLVPTYALVSSARRTQATWTAVAQGAGTSLAPQVQDAAYTANADTAVDLLRAAPEDAEVVVYVGHNPTAATLAHLLDDGEPDPDAFRSLSSGFPPAALAVLEVPVPWADLAAGTSHLAAFHVGGQ
jgi:phosphohistidine phosphatase